MEHLVRIILYKKNVFVVQKIPVILSLVCQLNNKEKKTQKYFENQKQEQSEF